jgi:hypothetical protein
MAMAKRYNESVKLALIMTDQDQAAPETPQKEKYIVSQSKRNWRLTAPKLLFN